MEESKDEVEAKVSDAMHNRLADFRDQADSLTLEGVRRVLEKDLGLETFALDTHKKFVKQWMEKYFYGPNESDLSKNSEAKIGGATAFQLENTGKKHKGESLETEKKVENSSLDSDAVVKNDPEATPVDDISEEKIQKAIKKRATYFRENSEIITMAGVRRLLEEDLKLAKNSLDAHKSFIKNQLDECLSTESEEPSNGARMSKSKKSAPARTKATLSKSNKRKKNHGSGSSEDLSGSEACTGSEDSDEENKAQKLKTSKAKSKPLKKQKIIAKERKPFGPRKKTPAKDENSDTENEGSASEDNRSNSSTEESPKKSKEKPTPIYGKKVEHLKSVIKSCGMSVPPSVYKRAKDAPESKRETLLIKELEGILEREGLSTNPSEKEIKALKRRKERAKELEGIDTSNIVSSSRRRTASSFIPTKPQIPIESDEEEDDEDDSDDGNTDTGVSSGGSDGEEESD